ncbi:hypothetical protein MMC20_001737 [Loxospora ochrophaea]|nr:hypothetical protein [Loxospora ochrophaea]
MSRFPFLGFLREQSASTDLDPKNEKERDEVLGLLTDLECGDFHKILTSSFARVILGHIDDSNSTQSLVPKLQDDWNEYVTSGELPSQSEQQQSDAFIEERLLAVGLAAFEAFLQSNVTGPPLQWTSPDIVFPKKLSQDLHTLRRKLISSLAVDGEAVYALTPNIELFCLARFVIHHPSIVDIHKDIRWARLRVDFWHQRMLSENAPRLQQSIYEDLEHVSVSNLASLSSSTIEARIQLLLERVAIHTHHGLDVKAREDLDRAAKESDFQFVLTGRLGKRTKFQQQELSQLVVLAKSARSSDENGHPTTGKADLGGHQEETRRDFTTPQNLDLNDDTLLESISFSKTNLATTSTEDSVPDSLASLDPTDQPLLRPLDSIILLSYASSITNTSPQHGLTREETLPYATRVLEGGSANWQVYTQALLVRSRIEGYRSRTVERGVLQLQALVDQVIAETNSHVSSETSNANTATNGTTTFLPRPKPSESAPVSERLQYVHQLASPTRWILEAELAGRWVSLGGLRTALEIYERLEMWAETALCWAAVDREDKARRIVRRQLYLPASENDASTGDHSKDEDIEEYLGRERDLLPPDAPRLLCILADIEKSPALYERAWAVSNNRYARAQRSLGKYYVSTRDLYRADEAYTKSLKINPLNQSTWFALGCVRLELQDWKGAADAFARAVQLQEDDAEAWSNLAVALLRLSPNESASTSDPSISPSASNIVELEDDTPSIQPKPDSQKHTKEAFVALKRAATLKRDSYRIWQNLLTVSARLSPPPYTDILLAQQRIIELRGSVEGEACVDAEIVEGLLAHVIASAPPTSSPRPASSTATAEAAMSSTNLEDSAETKPSPRRGLDHMLTRLVRTHIMPLITHSRRLWLLTARLALHHNDPAAALAAYEKAWRVTLNRPEWDSGGGGGLSSSTEDESPASIWKDVVDATTELVDAYESLGDREKTGGLGQGAGEGPASLVSKDWRFKARSAIRGVLGRGKEWEGTGKGWEELKARMTELQKR